MPTPPLPPAGPAEDENESMATFLDELAESSDSDSEPRDRGASACSSRSPAGTAASSDDGPGAAAAPSQPEVARGSPALSKDIFDAKYRHKAPLHLPKFAAGWAALERWSDPSHLASLLDEDVLVLQSRNSQRFLKRDCEQMMQPFGAVVHRLFGGGDGGESAAGAAAGAACADGASGGGGEGGASYARAPLRAGLRAEVDLQGLAHLAGCVEQVSGCGGAGAAAVEDARPSAASDADSGSTTSGNAGGGGAALRDANCGVWLGSAGNITPLHYDLCHGFLVQVIGTKTVTYFEPDDFRRLY